MGNKTKNNLKLIRNKKGLTQEKLSNITGITRSYIAKIESEKAEPSAAIAIKLSKALDCSVEDIFLPDVYSCEYGSYK